MACLRGERRAVAPQVVLAGSMAVPWRYWQSSVARHPVLRMGREACHGVPTTR